MTDWTIIETPEAPSFTLVEDTPQESSLPMSPQAREFLAKMQASGGPQYDTFQRVDDAVRSAMDAATLGFGDVAAGKLDQFMGLSSSPDPVATARAQTAASQERLGPMGSIATQVAGSMLPASGLLKAGVTAGRAVPAGLQGLKGLAARMGVGAVDSAALNAASALGHGEDPASAAAVGAALGPAATLAGAGAGKIAEKASAAAKKFVPPTTEALEKMKRAAYKHADSLGVVYAPNAVDDLVSSVGKEATKMRINPSRHPKAASIISSEIAGLSGKAPTLTEMDQLRQVVRRDLLASPDAAEKAFGSMIIDKIDNFIETPGFIKTLSGDAGKGASAIKAARNLNRKFKASETFDEAILKAERRAASTGSGGNVQNTIKQNIRGILDNKKKSIGFTKQELTAMDKVVRGTKGENVARLIGKAAPTGIVSGGLGTSMGAAIGSALGGPAGAAVGSFAVPAVGAVSKRIADKSTIKAAEAVSEMIRRGGSRPKVSSPEAAKQIEMLLRALMVSPSTSLTYQGQLQGSP